MVDACPRVAPQLNARHVHAGRLARAAFTPQSPSRDPARARVVRGLPNAPFRANARPPVATRAMSDLRAARARRPVRRERGQAEAPDRRQDLQGAPRGSRRRARARDAPSSPRPRTKGAARTVERASYVRRPFGRTRLSAWCVVARRFSFLVKKKTIREPSLTNALNVIRHSRVVKMYASERHRERDARGSARQVAERVRARRERMRTYDAAADAEGVELQKEWTPNRIEPVFSKWPEARTSVSVSAGIGLREARGAPFDFKPRPYLNVDLRPTERNAKGAMVTSSPRRTSRWTCDRRTRWTATARSSSPSP